MFDLNDLNIRPTKYMTFKRELSISHYFTLKSHITHYHIVKKREVKTSLSLLDNMLNV